MDDIVPLIPFTPIEQIIPGDVVIDPNVYCTEVQDDASFGTQMRLDKPDSEKQLKLVSTLNANPVTLTVVGSTFSSITLGFGGWVQLLYLTLGNDGRPLNRWEAVGGIGVTINP